MTLSIIILSVSVSIPALNTECSYAECQNKTYYAESHGVECRYAEGRGAIYRTYHETTD